MDIQLFRINGSVESTIGLLWVDGAFEAFTLEDQFQPGPKVYAETRIPPGRYRLALRRFGRFHELYRRRFAAIHLGMIEILEVPGFTDILIHCGNDDNDTAGCVLVGDGVRQNVTGRGWLFESSAAYRRVYPPIARGILAGDCWLTIHEPEQPQI